MVHDSVVDSIIRSARLECVINIMLGKEDNATL